METSVEQLIKDRTFASLTGEELKMVEELCANEEEFQTMKRFFQELEAVSASRKTIINPEVKQSLDGIFSTKYPGIRNNWTSSEAVAPPAAPIVPLYQRTWVRVAAIAVLLLGTAPFWNVLKTDMPVKDRPVTARVSSDGKKVPKVEPTVAGTTAEQKTADEVLPGAVVPERPAPDTMVSTGMLELKEMSDVFLWSESTDRSVAFESKDTERTNSGTYSAATLQPAYGFTAAAVPPVMKKPEVIDGHRSFAVFGRNADLNPDDRANLHIVCSLAEQPDDLLDLLVPAF